MTFRRTIAGAGVLIGIVLAIAWLSGWFEAKIPPGETLQAPAQVPAGAEVATVARVVAPALEWASGGIESARRTTVAVRILARLEEVRVAAGDEVTAGDTLARLDARDPMARLQQARQALKAARAQHDLARQEFERVEELLKRGVTTRQRFDRSVSALRVAEAEVARLRQSIGEAETAVSYTEIKAPVSGRVVDRLAEPGDIVSPGQPILHLYDPTALRVEAPVRESLAIGLKVGDSLRIEIAALGQTMTGTIEEIVPYAEPGARTLLVKVRLPGDLRLFAGMFARVAVPAGDRTRLLVPAAAIARIGQLEYATVVVDGRASKRMVTTGRSMDDGRIEVLSGLAEGERVVVPGAG
jgi:RND family efflux transporter MFP subunit